MKLSTKGKAMKTLLRNLKKCTEVRDPKTPKHVSAFIKNFFNFLKENLQFESTLAIDLVKNTMLRF